ncbi:hypothetical protein [Bacteroides neonati]|uniref:hypothetical protein n=1 Tax=Bacteroides neonati TaxID=1347393 RepID=UPI0004B3578B|nr:hypothetical protein [Bacteroides neonati]
MTILEQILAGLQTKFSGVDAATLTRIATKKAEGVTDASQVPTIVEGVGFTDVLNSYGDFRAGDATFKSVQNYEKKHNLKDGKPIENPNPNPNPNPQEKKEDVPAWAQSLIDSNKTLSEKLAGYEQKEAQNIRGAQIQAKAKEYGIPETLLPMLKIADDADLDTYFKDAKQTFTNEGLKGVIPPDTGGEVKTETENIANMINEGTKTIVEQNKN